MAVNIFWPPLTVLAFFVTIVAFLILKYGDRFLKARTTPLPQNYEIEDQSSENTTFVIDERVSMDEMEQYPMQEAIITSKEKYEYAV